MEENVLFCGYGKLGLECLKKLIKENYNIVYILTHKDGSDKSVDKYAIQKNIDFSYKDIRKEKTLFEDLIKKFKMDYLVSINYRYIFPMEALSTIPYAINIHGSLLPKYRGRTPHVWGIINGEEYSGVTCHLIDEGVDTGNIIEQVKIKIDSEDTGYSLLQKFERVYPDLLISSLNKLQRGVKPTKQNEKEASYYGRRIPDMGYIDFYKLKNQVINFVRAQAYPYPGAYYYLTNGKKIIINSLSSECKETILIERIGVIALVDDCYYVRCLDGILKLVDYEILG